ncbi:hypothetical protein Lalb_Chr20g0122991 [Lupinus albus]|uniref:Uncharacterized protein n=1 Tax=Lupinus albus TaxID=3870 RepID=A0A6A4NQT8_LUPAL|nr:hypothetical protein Lalb_Chr20g0122991 [Lupinus albus]
MLLSCFHFQVCCSVVCLVVEHGKVLHVKILVLLLGSYLLLLFVIIVLNFGW